MSVSKIAAERNLRTLLDLAATPGNDACADCKTRNPRWASWNLGIFICVKCAAVHRKIGTHITKVKSLNLDTWTKEQVDHMKEMGNVKSNAHFNPDEIKHPPPTNMIEQERDSDLEKYIRGKYEFKKFVDKSAIVAAHLGTSASKASVSRPKSTPLTSSGTTGPSAPPKFDTKVLPPPPRGPVSRSASQPIPSRRPRTQTLPKSNSVWDDLLSLETSSKDTSLPLQFAPQPSPSFQPSVAPTAQPIALGSANPYFNSQPQSTPFTQQLSTTPSFSLQPGFDTMGASSLSNAPSAFTNSVQPRPANPFLAQQFAGATPLYSQAGQPQMLQQMQPMQQPFLSLVPAQAPLNPFFAQQQSQSGMFVGSQPSTFAPSPFSQQTQAQHPNNFTQGSTYSGWQGQPGAFPVQQQPWG